MIQTAEDGDYVCTGMDIPIGPWGAEEVAFWTSTERYQPWKDVAVFFRLKETPVSNETTTDRSDVAELKDDIAWAEKAEAEALDEYDEAKRLTQTLREHLRYLEGVICKQPCEGDEDQPG